MAKIKMNKSQLNCAIAMFIIVAGYACERVVSIVFEPDKNLAIILGMIFTALVAAVYFLISKAEDSFYGLLAALLGYKMMPPNVSMLDKTSTDGSMLFYIVKKVAVVIFVLLILKLYEAQPKPRAIKPLALLGLMVMVPFFTGIGQRFDTYFMQETGSMLYVYFTDFACYALATIVIIGFGYQSGYESMVFTAYFEYIALGINILRRAVVVIAKLATGDHVSKSYYVWLALYVVLIAVTAIAKKTKYKKISE